MERLPHDTKLWERTSMMNSTEEALLTTIEESEAEAAAVASYDFIPVSSILSRWKLDKEKVNDALESLSKKRLILWDKQVGVKSRVGHILHCLRNSEAVSRRRALRNVADLKYIRYVKQVTKRVISLSDDSLQAQLDSILGFR